MCLCTATSIKLANLTKMCTSEKTGIFKDAKDLNLVALT